MLDTDTCVFWLRGHQAVRERMLDVSATDPSALAIGVVTLAELRYGASYSERPEENHRAVDDFLTGVTVLPVTMEGAVPRTNQRSRKA